jgi:hypothetical protein
MKKALLFLLIILLWINFLINNLPTFTRTYDIDYWQKEFLNTQLVKGDKAPRYYSDTEIYAIVGYKYIRGEDPTKIHPEVPPLGKWLIGLSIVIFKNPVIINLLLGWGGLLFLYLISTSIVHKPVLGLLVVLFTSLDSQFRLLLTDAYLDIPLFFFLTLALWSFLQAQRKPHWFVLTGFAIGFMMGTKFYFTSLLLYAVLLCWLFLKGNFRAFFSFVLSSPIILLAYALPYWSAFIQGMNPVGFWHFQGWLTSWWAGNARIPWGTILPLIWSGSWFTWWGPKSIIKVQEWSLLWPVCFIFGLVSIYKIIQNRTFPLLLIWMWSVCYLAFLTFTSPFPRYLIILMPFMYLLSLYSLHV